MANFVTVQVDQDVMITVLFIAVNSTMCACLLLEVSVGKE